MDSPSLPGTVRMGSDRNSWGMITHDEVRYSLSDILQEQKLEEKIQKQVKQEAVAKKLQEDSKKVRSRNNKAENKTPVKVMWKPKA